MSATEFAVGHVAEPFRMPVELGKIREYARATKAQDRDYFEREDPAAPPTFLVTELLWQEPRHSGWGSRPPDFERVLHGEQEFIFHGPPPRAGTVLTGQARLDRVTEKDGRRGGRLTIIEIVTEFRDETGRLVAEAISTSLETSVPTTGAA
jgi:hypothetical protein